MGKIAILFAVFVSVMLVVPYFAHSRARARLVGCWEFDEGSGVTAVDSSGNGNHGLIVNATYTGDDIPPQELSGYSLVFNSTWGNAYSYVTIPDNSSLRPSSGLTLAAWVKAGTYEGRMRTIISKQLGSGGGDSFVLWYHDDGNLWFDVGAVGHIITVQPPANEWHYIVATYDGSFMRLYVDGVEKVNGSGSGSIPYDGNPVLIGADSNQADHTPDSGWNGTIDDVLIYNRALSQAEIAPVHDIAVTHVTPPEAVIFRNDTIGVNATIENRGDITETFNVTLYAELGIPFNETGLVGYWSFDELSGQTVQDDSGNGNVGIIYGANATYGNLGPALDFDGVDDYVEVPDSPSLNVSAMTVMAWVQFRTLATGSPPVSMVVAKGIVDTVSGWFGLEECYKPDVFRFSFTEGGYYNGVDGTTQLVENTWYHAAGTYDGSVLKLYVNGVLEAEKTVNITRSPSTQNIQIGALRWSPSYNYWTNGVIDEVKIYNRALSEEEIQTHVVSSQKIETKEMTLANQSSATMAFVWNTTDFQYGNYSINAYAAPVPGETLISDNIKSVSMFQVIIPEFPSFLILPFFMIATLITIVLFKRRHSVKEISV